MKVYLPRLVCLLVVLLFAAGCERTDLSKRTVERMLESTIHEEIKGICVFSASQFPYLYAKPEFADFKDENICTISFSVLDIDKISPDHAVVEYRVDYVAVRRKVSELLTSWNEMEDRLLSLHPVKVPHPEWGLVTVFSDPYDGHVFLVHPDSTDTITATHEWQMLKEVREAFAEVGRDRIISSEIKTVEIRKDNSDWQFEK